jgi:hypothetical protein
MIKIHSNIIIGNLCELQQIITNVSYIINCHHNYSQLSNHPNYLNLIINNINYETLNLLIQVYDFINNKILLNQNIFLLSDTGLNESLFIGMFFLMKFHNANYQTIYYNIAFNNRIYPYEYYASLTYFEPHILKLYIHENMDLS